MNAPETTAPALDGFEGADAARWTHRYASLGPDFFTELPGSGLPDPQWVATSPDCAALLGWSPDWWTRPGSLEVFSGNALLTGMRPLATVYSGHQFGVWAGQLGDGRALMLGGLDTPNGHFELQLKGAGLTPYSRRGDGRAVLRSSIREFLCSEAMAALGIPTTRALAITGSTRLKVQRETVETSAIVTRVAPSFLRFGHFEHFAHHGMPDQLRVLFDHFVRHHAPECAEAPNPVTAVLAQVAAQTAEMVARWQAVGFMHGVMNTDNMSMLGLTIDYGPFGFMDGFDPGHVCNHSDHQGRYAFARQPQVAFWNLHALAQALLPLMPNVDTDQDAAGDELIAALDVYRERFGTTLLGEMRAKLGLGTALDEDGPLVDDWLRLLALHHTDYTIAHRRLAAFDPEQPPEAPTHAPLRDLFVDRDAFDAWAHRYAGRLKREPSDACATRAARMHAVNPAVVLRNHLAETAIRQAEAGDFSEVRRLLDVLRRPFDEPAQASDAGFPPDWAQTLEVSCSS
ncbi:hypothetical protein CDN99_02645 [Roseateles aquatilis]|uniref:Protein nucleotidyltransferase YdiU n=1 Tax=Roseateles aquatilis TaxID=431061 RepID=A0A246JLB1_9BURK|nr:YdiU family protein [Roseateles aquatilis]OWQ93397.1 hypothetical protein CDN99_02645 [Roseateles aquatilis]